VEIELSLGKTNYLREIIIAILVLSLAGLGWLGSVVTRTGPDGSAQVLTWSDYQLGKAEKAYQVERQTLREDADTLTAMLSQKDMPGPVAVQVTANRILEHASSGVAELADARTALGNAAIAVCDWSVGTVDKNTATQAMQSAISLLSE
jgi:hypothetical protein